MRKPAEAGSWSFIGKALVATILCWFATFLALTATVSAANPPGSWTIVPSGNAALVNALVSVACPSSSDCWAVGRARNAGIWQTLIEHWDGNGWNTVSSPNTSTSDTNTLAGVACSSASQCWAVGAHNIMNFGVAEPLIEQWNGTAWAIYSSPLANPVQQDGVLSAVTCVSASNCWAVGYYVSGNFNQTLIQHWDGSTWLTVTSANTSSRESNVLNAVSCISSSDCWAVGNHDVGTPVGGAAPQATLTEHWDGTSWSVVPSPNPTTNYDVLLGVSCTSSSDCNAVGLYAVGVIYQTLVEHWNGLIWQVINSPNPNPNQDNAFEGVTCNSATDCWAVGYYNAGDVNSPKDNTLICHWDGTSWSNANSPNRADYQYNFLWGITCPAGSECWAVGASDTPNAITLVEHYQLRPVQLVSAVSRMTHGDAGTFDVHLPLTGDPGVECRRTNGNYALVFTLGNALTNIDKASVTDGAGSVATSKIDPNDAHNYIVNLSGVTDAQIITVRLTNVTDVAGDFSPALSVSMRLLAGDVNGNAEVTNADVSLVKAQVAAGGSVNSTNFRNDVNANGGITNADVSITKAQVAAGAQLR